jgi:hypothetical protein
VYTPRRLVVLLVLVVEAGILKFSRSTKFKFSTSTVTLLLNEGVFKSISTPLFLEDENLANPARLGRCMLLSPAASKQYSRVARKTFKIQNSKFKSLKIGTQGVDVEHFAIGVWAI